MSQQNVELAFRGNDGFNRRDLAAFLALMDSEVKLIPYEVSVEGGRSYRGHGGVRTWWEETFEVFPDLTVEIEGYDVLGNTTLEHGHLRGRGAGSTASFERTYWGVVEWRDEKAIWWRAFGDEAEAIEAARQRA